MHPRERLRVPRLRRCMARQRCMDSFVVHLLDGLSLGVIYGLLAMGYALASCAGRWFILTDAAASLLGAAVSLMTLTVSAMVGVRFEAVALLIAFIASFAAASVSGWAIGVNLHIFAARQQRGSGRNCAGGPRDCRGRRSRFRELISPHELLAALPHLTPRARNTRMVRH